MRRREGRNGIQRCAERRWVQSPRYDRKAIAHLHSMEMTVRARRCRAYVHERYFRASLSDINRGAGRRSLCLIVNVSLSGCGQLSRALVLAAAASVSVFFSNTRLDRLEPVLGWMRKCCYLRDFAVPARITGCHARRQSPGGKVLAEVVYYRSARGRVAMEGSDS